MTRLPGVADLGAAPIADRTRPVADYDVSGVARAGAALAEGGRQLGAGIVKAGEGIADYGQAEDRWQYAQAHSDFITKKIDLDAGMQAANEYGPDASGKALPQRYQDSVGDLQSKSAGLIQSGPMRDRFLMDTKPVVEQGVVAATQKAKSLENDASLAYVTQQGDAIIDRAVAAPDDATRRQLIDTHNRLVDGLNEKGAISDVQAVAMKQAWAHQYATADLLHRADTDPQGVINELRAAPGSADQVVARIAAVEGTTRNDKSSATGTGQFLDATWLDVLKRNRPDLAQGKTDDQLIELRADKQLGLQMTSAYAKENGAYLKNQGLPVTPGNTYLAHFLGPAGAAAVLKGDPNQPVVDVLSKALGPDKAQAMVDANPKVLGGQLAGSVTQWADGKMGGAVPGAGSIYDQLRPDVREQVLAQAMAKQHAQVADDLTSFKAKVDDTTTEAMRTGNVAVPLQKTDFIRSLGAEAGPKQYASYAANIQLGKDTQSVSQLDPDQQRELVASYAPKPGEGYSDQAQRQDIVAKAVRASNAERDKDPAGFAIARLPVVGDAYKKLSATLSDPAATSDAKAAAAREYATKTMMEQQRIGVPRDSIALAPAGYVDGLDKAFTTASTAEDPQARLGLIARVNQEKAMWGDAWPQLMRQLPETTQPVVRAIGAGANPVAMSRLLALPPKESPVTILKEQDEVTARNMTKAVNSALTPWRTTLVGPQAEAYFNGYNGLVQKLAALYVRDGVSAETAAGNAFNAVIGDRYNFRDSWRAPNDPKLNIDADAVQRGTLAARDALANGKSGDEQNPFGRLRLQQNDMGLSDNEADSRRNFARNGVFVTSPKEDGLNIAYNTASAPGFVSDRDGKRILLTWDQLARVGGTAEAKAADLTRAIAESAQTP